MNDHDYKQIAEHVTKELKKGHGCTVFDEDTIMGIKAISTMYNDGRRGLKTFTLFLIGIGAVVLMIAGLKHWLKDF